jgi:hypothetical protein
VKPEIHSEPEQIHFQGRTNRPGLEGHRCRHWYVIVPENWFCGTEAQRTPAKPEMPAFKLFTPYDVEKTKEPPFL